MITRERPRVGPRAQRGDLVRPLAKACLGTWEYRSEDLHSTEGGMLVEAKDLLLTLRRHPAGDGAIVLTAAGDAGWLYDHEIRVVSETDVIAPSAT